MDTLTVIVELDRWEAGEDPYWHWSVWIDGPHEPVCLDSESVAVGCACPSYLRRLGHDVATAIDAGEVIRREVLDKVLQSERPEPQLAASAA